MMRDFFYPDTEARVLSKHTHQTRLRTRPPSVGLVTQRNEKKYVTQHSNHAAEPRLLHMQGLKMDF